MKKKLLSILLSLAMVFSLLPMSAFAAETGTSGKNFPDIVSHWGKASIERWAGYGVLNGDNKGNFNPDNPMTRAEFATMLVNLMGYTSKGRNSFGDVDASAWYADAVLKLAAAGIMKGDGTNANPNAYISRQEAAVLLCRVFGITAKSTSVNFADKGSIASWALDSVAALYERDMIAGVGSNQFAPLDNINRASVAKMIDNMITTYVSSGSVTVDQSTEGIVLVAGGSVTIQESAEVARLVVAPKASGSTVTVEKKAVVESMEIAAGKVSVKGNGAVTELTVTGDAGVTVAKDVAVKKLTNDSDSAVTYGSQTVKAGDTYKGDGASTPSGSGSSGSSSGTTSKVPNESEQTGITTAADLVEAAGAKARNVTATVAEGNEITKSDDITITTHSKQTGALTLNLDAIEAGDVVINAPSAGEVIVNGTGSLNSLTINAPSAHVTDNVKVINAVTIQAVADNTFVVNASVGSVVMEGQGKVEVAADVIAPAITVNTTENVVLTGNIADVNVTEAGNVTVSNLATSSAPVITSENSNTQITVNTAQAVTLGGDIGKVTAPAADGKIALQAGAAVTEVVVPAGTGTAATAITGSGTVATVTTSAPVKIDATATKVDVQAEATITGSGAISEVVASAPVTLETSVAKVTVPETATNAAITVAEGKTVSVVETATDVAIQGQGQVASVDVNAAKDVKVTVDDTAGVGQVTKADGSSGGVTATKGQETILVATKAVPPADVGFKAPIAVGGQGQLTGLTDKMEYKLESATTWNQYTAASVTVDAGAYFVRTVGDTEKGVLPSEAVPVVIPAAVGVSSAAIIGTPVVGQTLTAKANADATGELTYVWKYGDEAITSATGNTLTVEDKYVDSMITVAISNYGGTAQTAAAADKVTADKTALTKAIALAEKAYAGVKVLEETDTTTTEANTPKGVVFVAYADQQKLLTAIGTAKATGCLSTQGVAEAVKALNDAVSAYETAKKTGNETDTDKLKSALATLITDAGALKTNGLTESKSNDGLDVKPTEKWVTNTATEALAAAIITATTAKDATGATVDTLSAAITSLNAAMTKFQGSIQNGATIDTMALEKAIASATANAASVATDSDGAMTAPTKTWTTEANKKTYTEAIAAAQTVAGEAETQSAVITALTTLTEAATAFNATVKPGTKDVTAPVVTGVTVERITGATAKVSFTSNEAGKYAYTATGAQTSEGTGELSANTAATITLSGLDSTKPYTVPIKVSDAAGNTTEVVAVIPAYTFANTKVTEAKLHDTRNESQDASLKAQAIADEDLYAAYAVKATAAGADVTDYNVLVTITADRLREHQNADTPESMGYWVGFVPSAPEGADGVQYAFSEQAIASDAALKTSSDGSIAFYTNAGAENPKVYAKVQWTQDGKAFGDAIVYKMDLSHVTKGFQVSFDVDGGSAVTAQVVAENAFAVQPDDPAKAGYTFDGWFTKTDGQFDQDAFAFATQKITADVTLYAKWMGSEPPIKNDPTVMEANLVDHATQDPIASENLVTDYTVKLAQSETTGVNYVVTITGSGLRKHTNGAGTVGHWIGFAVAAPAEGDVTGFICTFTKEMPTEAEWTAAKAEAVGAIDQDGTTNGAAFYSNIGGNPQKEYVKLQWVTGNPDEKGAIAEPTPVGDPIVFQMDLTGVEVYAEATAATVADEAEFTAALANPQITSITLSDDITLTATANITSEVTLDLNGKKLTNGEKMNAWLILVGETGNLTLKDSVKDGQGIVGGYTKGGTDSDGKDNGYSVDPVMDVKGTFSMESGKISTTDGRYYAVKVSPKGNVTIGGTAEVTSSWSTNEGIAIAFNGSQNNQTLTIEGNAKITGGEQAMYLPGKGVTTINDDPTIQGGARGIEIRSGELTVNGGTITANAAACDLASATFKGGYTGAYTGAIVAGVPASAKQGAYEPPVTVTINGGTLENKTADGAVLCIVNEKTTPGSDTVTVEAKDINTVTGVVQVKDMSSNTTEAPGVVLTNLTATPDKDANET